MKFEELDKVNTYDAIWACSSILHVQKEELAGVLDKMIKALKENGVMYISFKKGRGHEIKDGKYYHYITKEKMEKILDKVNTKVKVIRYFETLPSTKREATNTIWANFIIKKC